MKITTTAAYHLCLAIKNKMPESHANQMMFLILTNNTILEDEEHKIVHSEEKITVVSIKGPVLELRLMIS